MAALTVSTHSVPVRIGVEGSGRGSVHHAMHIMNGNIASHAVYVMYTIHISRGMRETGARHVYVWPHFLWGFDLYGEVRARRTMHQTS